ncbi:hypothetical protein ACHAO8_005416 [Botrytis cinerea]
MQTSRYYPGGGTDPVIIYENFPEDSWYSMDLPNLIEKFLELHSTRSMKRSVEVVWKGVAYKRLLETEFVESVGWNISTSPAENEEVLAIFGEYYDRSESFARYTLMRKELTGPLIAEHPMPFSSCRPCRFVDQQGSVFVEPKHRRILNTQCCLVQ